MESDLVVLDDESLCRMLGEIYEEVELWNNNIQKNMATIGLP